ncbi:MAG: hypothetical protein JWM10_3797 [Myxococcaceae bacterium]|nr:hypothetical protein [Myxococcaceae bacterium]
MAASEFIEVDVEPGPAHEDGLSMRFKRAGEARPVRALTHESEAGLDGWWTVRATDRADAAETREAVAVQVDDSSDGLCWLVAGGAHGLVLTHRERGATERVPYLLLSLRTAME